jgi:tetratricopeptide (TPR) repeat protein
MERAWGTAFCIALALGIVIGALGSATRASAQSKADDAAAREQFERGRTAFAETAYEEALVHFREAYRLSRRGQLQYNIGISADRLRRDDEALQAFEHYLAETENPSRAQEVQKRIEALRLAIAERQERERALAEAASVRYENAAVAEQTDRRVPKSAIIGSSVLAAVGAAGVITMGVGLSRNGQCLERDASSGACLTERTPSPWTAVYGAVGIAALAGSATWLVVSSKRSKDKRQTTWRLSPTGVTVSGSF